MIVHFDIMKGELLAERCRTLEEAKLECLFHCWDPLDDYYIKETFTNEYGTGVLYFNTEGEHCDSIREAILGRYNVE